jgi:hypothetical protein
MSTRKVIDEGVDNNASGNITKRLLKNIDNVPRKGVDDVPTTSSSIGKGRFNDNEFKELVSSDNVHVTNKVGAGAARPPRHHIFVQEQREWFESRGIDIDKYTIALDQGTHSAVHTMGWNKQWSKFIAREAKLGRQYTKREILAFGAQMRRQFGLRKEPLIHFTAP